MSHSNPWPVPLVATLGSLSSNVFERRTSTGSEVFSLLTCLDDIKFVFLSFFTVIEAIWLKICAKPPSKNEKRPLPVDVRRSKTLLLKLPIIPPYPSFDFRLWAVSLFSWSVDQNARDTQMTTRVTEGARRERHDSSRAAALFSRVSRLRRSTLARACTPLTKSEEKERLLAVYSTSSTVCVPISLTHQPLLGQYALVFPMVILPIFNKSAKDRLLWVIG